MTFDPSLLRSHVWLYPRIIVYKSHENTSKYVDTVILFFKNLNQRSLPIDDLWLHICWGHMCDSTQGSLERFSRAGPRGRGREWATLGVHPLSWLLSNNRLEKVPFVSVLHTSSNRLLLSNQDKGCTPCVAHSLPLPLGPALLNLWTVFKSHVNTSMYVDTVINFAKYHILPTYYV